jgi:hypothetical protein
MRWGEFDFLVNFVVPGQSTRAKRSTDFFFKLGPISKPVAVVIPPTFESGESNSMFENINNYVADGRPVYFSFDSAANAINLVLTYYERIA